MAQCPMLGRHTDRVLLSTQTVLGAVPCSRTDGRERWEPGGYRKEGRMFQAREQHEQARKAVRGTRLDKGGGQG